MNKEKIISLSLVGAIGLGSCMPAMAMPASDEPDAKRVCLGSSQSSKLTAMEVEAGAGAEADEVEDNDKEVLKKDTPEQLEKIFEDAYRQINDISTKVGTALLAIFDKSNETINAKIKEIYENAEIKREAADKECKETIEDLEATGTEVWLKYAEANEHFAKLLEKKAGEHPAEIEEARRKLEELGKAREEACKKIGEVIDEAVVERERKIAKIDATAEEQEKAIEDVRSEVGEVSKMLHSKLFEVMDNKLKMLDTAHKTLSTEGIGPEERAKAINEFIALVDGINKMYSEAAPRITRAAGELIGKYVLCKAIYEDTDMFFKQIGDFNFNSTNREEEGDIIAEGLCLFGEMVNKKFEMILPGLINDCTKYNETKRMEKAKVSTVVAEAEYRAKEAAYNKVKASLEKLQEAVNAYTSFSSMQSVNGDSLRWLRMSIVEKLDNIIKIMKGAAKAHAEEVAKAADNQAEVDAGEVAEADDNQAEVDAGAAAEADNNQAEE